MANFAPKPSALQLARKRFGTALNLGAGWDGPNSVPISKVAVNTAQTILEPVLASAEYQNAPFIVPCSDGSLQLEWHTVDTEIELHVDVDGSLSLWVHDRLTGAEFETEGPSARAAFVRAVSQLCTKVVECAAAPIQEAICA
jgi:hypothetical protein